MKDKKFKHSSLEDEQKCGENCDCGDNCECESDCTCDGECKCVDECECGDECKCGENCECGEDCSCHGEQKCNDNCTCEKEVPNEYLELARRIQAEFENFRKRTETELTRARQEGEISVIEAFLPCLDTFKIAKKSITDQKVLEGVEMIENNILATLEKLGVEKIEAIGQKFDHNLHNVIAIMRDEDKEEDIILEEYQAGYKYHDKVIRYSKVIVNKKGE